MRHLKKKKFGRGMDSRRKLLRTLASSVILYEKITTTYSNARAVRPYVERAITRSKNSDLATRRYLISKLTNNAAKKAIEVVGPRFKDRNGGYIRLTKLTDPKSGLSKVVVELV